MKGRKSKYHTVIKPNLELIEGWLREGISERDIARKLHVAHSTFQEYKRVHPDFSDRLKKGRELADIQVENALFRSAVGYEYEEVKTEYYENGKKALQNNDPDAKQSKKITKTTRRVLGDVTAQIFWLKNRRPDKWRDRKEIDANLSTPEDIQKFRELLGSMSPAEKMKALHDMELNGPQ